MNRFFDFLAKWYAPLGRRGLLMDGQYRFAPDVTPQQGGRRVRSPRLPYARPFRHHPPEGSISA